MTGLQSSNTEVETAVMLANKGFQAIYAETLALSGFQGNIVKFPD
jgi:hypothetical protein